MQPRALVFDAYGTLFDVHSVQARAEAFWPGKAAEFARLRRAKQHRTGFHPDAILGGLGDLPPLPGLA